MDTERILRTHPGWVITASAALPIVLCWLMSLAGKGLANTTGAIALVLPVVAAAASGMRWAGVAAALAAAAAFDFFLTAPFHDLRISDPADLETGALLLLVGLAVSEIAVRSRRHQARFSREQGYLDGLLRTAGAVAAGSATSEQLADVVRQELIDLLGLDDCWFDPAITYGLPHLGADGGLLRRDRVVDVGRLGLPTDSAIALPVRAGGNVLGHFVLTASTQVRRPSRQQLRVAVMLADQVGSALAVTAHR